jgi:hypothetical protein
MEPRPVTAYTFAPSSVRVPHSVEISSHIVDESLHYRTEASQIPSLAQPPGLANFQKVFTVRLGA